jgi:hypothetical protein
LRRRPALLCGLRGAALTCGLLAGLFACGCSVSNVSSPFGAGSADSAASSVTEDRLLETAKADSGTDLPGGMSAHCPQVVAWPKDRLVTIYQGGKTGDAEAVIHRGEITKMARECQIYSDRVMVKYGFAGRVLLGPKGKSGNITFPVNVHVQGPDHKTLANDRMSISTTIPAGSTVGYFSMVRQVSFPIRIGTRPEDYKVFVAFDQNVPGAG